MSKCTVCQKEFKTPISLAQHCRDTGHVQDWETRCMSRTEKPLDDMDYLDGYLSFVFDDDDAPDGAWFEMCKSTIAEHWGLNDDGHEEFMAYLEWKSQQPNSGVTIR